MIDEDGWMIPMGGCAGGPWGFLVKPGDTTSKGARARQVIKALNATTPATFRKKRKATVGERKAITESKSKWVIRVRARDVPKHVFEILR